MQKSLIATIVVSSFIASSCRKVPGTCSVVQSAHNNVSCKVDYSKLMQDRLSGIRIVDIGINQKEKIRHLNELNIMPKEFLNVMRGRITINMTEGGITNLPDYSHLRGVMPRGWPAGSTWDMVPGAGGHDGLALGNSGLNNNAMSLAIHEAAHSVDSQTNFTNTKEFQAAFNADKGRPHPNDSNGTYRTNYPEEYIAIAVDEYYCSPETKQRLKEQYPRAFALVDQHFTRLLVASGKQTEPAGGGGDGEQMPAPAPKPMPEPTPKPMPAPTPKPTPTPMTPAPTPTPNPVPSPQAPNTNPGVLPLPAPIPLPAPENEAPLPGHQESGDAGGKTKLPSANEISNETMRVDPIFVKRRTVPNDSWCD